MKPMSDQAPLRFRSSGSEAPIFVLGCSQRTGTTALQRLLNSHRQVLIWGEHDGYLNRLHEGYISLMAWKAAHPASPAEFLSLSRAYFMPNVIPDKAVLRTSFLEHVRSLFPTPGDRDPDCRWGFKEVRYNAYLALFLQELFPNACFIHVVRHIENCLVSMRKLEAAKLWQSQWTADALRNWIDVNRSFVDARHQLNNYFLVRHEDLRGPSSNEIVANIERFLGIKPNGLDRGVLKKNVDFGVSAGSAYRLTEEERTLLCQPEIVELLGLYGYEA